jgi:hypothetical protein
MGYASAVMLRWDLLGWNLQHQSSRVSVEIQLLEAAAYKILALLCIGK